VACDKLEAKGLIRRMRSIEDRRVVNVVLTAKGRAAYEYHKAFHERMIASVLDTLSPEQTAILAQSLEKLQDFFRQEEAAMGEEADGYPDLLPECDRPYFCDYPAGPPAARAAFFCAADARGSGQAGIQGAAAHPAVPRYCGGAHHRAVRPQILPVLRGHYDRVLFRHLAGRGKAAAGQKHGRRVYTGRVPWIAGDSGCGVCTEPVRGRGAGAADDRGECAAVQYFLRARADRHRTAGKRCGAPRRGQ